MSNDELICRSLRSRTSATEERKLLGWRRESAGNESHYQEMVRILDTADAVFRSEKASDRPSAVELIRLAERDVRVADRMARRKLRHWLEGVAAAAVVAAVLFAASRIIGPSSPSAGPLLNPGEFATGPGETATIALGDGSVVRLAPRSRLHVEPIPGRRDVALEGKAYFVVASREDAPFRVRTRIGTAVALGTRFELSVEQDLRVVVAEGRVAIGSGLDRVEVGAGEMSILSESRVSPPVKVDVRPILEWVEDFLAFQSTPLRQVARELEAAYDARVLVTDSALADLTVTGWYVDRTFEEVVTIVCGVVRAECSVRDGVAVIEPE